MKVRDVILFISITCALIISACSSVAVAPVPSATATLTLEPTVTFTAAPPPTATPPPKPKGVIAFFTGNGIMAMQADGAGDPRVLSAHPTSDSKPAWSPDGSRIAFESLRDDAVNQEAMDIYVMNSDGSNLTRLTNTDGYYMHPDWSPDGTKLVMTAELKEGVKDLYIVDVKTRELVQLTDDIAVDADPSWSQDGTGIVFGSDRDGSYNLYTLELKTNKVTQLTTGEFTNLQPDWSPDGKRILFVSNRDGDVEIYMMAADGKDQVRLTHSPGRDLHPTWSSDGNYFAFTHEESDIGSIHVMDLAASKSTLFFENPGKYAGYAAWSPVNAAVSREPMFGAPFCMKDTDNNFEPDQVTNTYTTKDAFVYVAFPYQNMSPDLSWSYTFEYENSEWDSMNAAFAWKHGESGWFITPPSGMSLSMIGTGKVTIQLFIEDKMVQELTCEITKP